jgi:type I restriction-modification system DNA methylase subunit
MARTSAKKTNILPLNQPQHEQLLLFSSSSAFWKSSLFNETYLQNDVPTKFRELWEQDEVGPFQVFCNQFVNICEELKDEDFNSWSERTTISKFIKPVLRMLGYFDNCSPNQEPWVEDESFTIKENGETKVYKPDFVVVNDPNFLRYITNKKGHEKVEEARQYTILPIEAKYWDRITDKKQNSPEDKRRSDKKDNADPTRALDFDDQCLKYMDILGSPYGILTDGKIWRLYNRELSNDSYRRNYQFNLGHLMQHVMGGLDHGDVAHKIFLENAKYFFHFFAKQSLYSEDGNRLFLDDILEYSKKYVSSVEEDLKHRFVKAISLACNGYKSVLKGGKKVELEFIRNVSESQLFNILFIRYCESRNILPLRDSADYKAISLSNLIDRLDNGAFDPERRDVDNNLYLGKFLKRDLRGKSYDPNGSELYDRLLSLTKIIQDGDRQKRYDSTEIKGFRQSIFSEEEWKFVDSYKLSNDVMVRILFELGYSRSERAGRKYQQIPYNFFSPRQLGSIYESFLEYRIEVADCDLAFIKKQWQPANLDSIKIRDLDVPTVRKNELYFTPNNKDRKDTGSYYTPDYIVQDIVRESLTPLIKNKRSHEIGKIRVCDPAMGSGHFLIAALNFLGRAYLAALERETNDDLSVTLQDVKQTLLHTCIFGIDLNQRAVKLAKMSLWLETAESGKTLENLEGQIRHGDSLIREELWKVDFKAIINSGGFDAVVGNPPYIRIQNLGSDEYVAKVKAKYKSTSHGNFDLYIPFVELGLRILRSGGQLGFILPNKFMTADYGAPIRQMLSENGVVREIVDFRHIQIFHDATTYTCLLFLENTRRSSFNYSTVSSVEDQKIGRQKAETLSLPTTEEVWGFANGPSGAALKRMKLSKKTLSEFVEKVYVGVQTSGDKIYAVEIIKRVSPDMLLVKSKLEGEEFEIESASVMPLLKGAEISRYGSPNYAQVVIFPYDILAGKPKGWTENALRTRFPKCLKYLKRHQKQLSERTNADRECWWLYTYPKNLTLYAKPKILIQVLSNSGKFCYDEEGKFCFLGGGTAGGNAISLKTENSDLSWALLGILNSPVTEVYVRSVSSVFRGGYVVYSKSTLEGMPLPNLGELEKSLLKNLADLVRKLNSCPTSKKREELEATVNEIVFNLYGLTKKEKEELISTVIQAGKIAA